MRIYSRNSYAMREGERHYRAKLTRRAVADARRLCRLGWSYAAVARRHDVSPTCVFNLYNGISWKRGNH